MYCRDELGESKVLKSDLKKSQMCPIWGQSDPLLSQNTTQAKAGKYRCEVNILRSKLKLNIYSDPRHHGVRHLEV